MPEINVTAVAFPVVRRSFYVDSLSSLTFGDGVDGTRYERTRTTHTLSFRFASE